MTPGDRLLVDLLLWWGLIVLAVVALAWPE